MRPIDADALKKSVLDLQDCYNGFSDTYDKACIIGTIDEQPTIEERKKGKWIKQTDTLCACTICKLPTRMELLFGEMVFYRFCPNCGADMREQS